MTPESLIPYAITAVVCLLLGMLAMHLIALRNPTSTKEQALKALDKAAKVVAALNDPGPEEQAQIAARLAREDALQKSVAASMAKIVPTSVAQ